MTTKQVCGAHVVPPLFCPQTAASILKFQGRLKTTTQRLRVLFRINASLRQRSSSSLGALPHPLPTRHSTLRSHVDAFVVSSFGRPDGSGTLSKDHVPDTRADLPGFLSPSGREQVKKTTSASGLGREGRSPILTLFALVRLAPSLQLMLGWRKCRAADVVSTMSVMNDHRPPGT